MTIQEAVVLIAQHVRKTGRPLAESIKELWPSLSSFSESDSRILMQEALAGRVSPVLTNPFRRLEESHALNYTSPESDDSLNDPITASWSSVRQPISVNVKSYIQPIKRVEVTVQLLQDTVYHVNGVAKAVAVFTRFDVMSKLDQVRQMEKGTIRHREMWEYVLGRLNTLNKKSVADLAEGEQRLIARRLFDLKHFKEPLALPD